MNEILLKDQRKKIEAIMQIFNRCPASPALGIKRVKKFDFSYDNEIGRGGFARVFTQSGRINRPIVVKIDNPAVALSNYSNYFIEREAQALLRLAHPNIVSCFGCGKLFPKVVTNTPPGSFVALEYLKDYTVARTYVARLGTRRLPVALGIFTKAVSAIEYVHGQGWVHADINEANIMTDGKNVKLIDFAFARPEGETVMNESNGWGAGTLAYMSLGRLRNESPTKADDIFALGIALCGLLLSGGLCFREGILRRAKLWNRYEIGLTFEVAQRKIECEINIANIPEQIKELMRRLLGLGDVKPFSDCREILEFIEQIQLPSTA